MRNSGKSSWESDIMSSLTLETESRSEAKKDEGQCAVNRQNVGALRGLL